MWLPEVESCLPAALPCGTGAAKVGGKWSEPDLEGKFQLKWDSWTLP